MFAADFDSAADLIRTRWSRRPVVGLVLGSGLNCLVDAIDVEAIVEAREIPGMPVSTAIGHRGRFVCGTLAGVPVIVQDGRLHSYEGHDFATCAWPVRLMLRLGIEALVVTNASGGVNPEFAPGDIMLIDDHINLMWGNPLIGPNDDQAGPRFPDMSAPYDAELAAAVLSVASSTGIKVHRGVYLALAGPNYETRAEYRMVRSLGADVVGMSTVPEVLVARHAGMRVLGLSIVANVFQPDLADETTGEAVVAQVAETAPRVGELVQRVIADRWGRAGQSEAASSIPVEAASFSVALLTGSGRGAVAVIRLAGDCHRVAVAVDQYFVAANGRLLEQQDVNALCYGVWGDSPVGGAESAGAEDVVVCRSGLNGVEIHCHGGPAAIERILDQLEQAGARRVDWQTQMLDEGSGAAVLTDGWLGSSAASPQSETADAKLQSSERPAVTALDVECRDALTRASTERTALWLLRQSQGLLRDELDELLRLAGQWSPNNAASAPAPAPVSAPVSASGAPSTAATELQTRLRQLLQRADFGMHLAEPWQVVLAGRPNVGKSTLLNALLGYARAIVFDEPGTTRDIVTGETAFDGWPFHFSDTAGVRETGSELEREGIRRTQQSIARADLVCLLLDVSVPPTADDRRLLADVQTGVPAEKLLIVAHKSDRPSVWGDELPTAALPVSSVTRDGVDQLAEQMVARLVRDIPAMDAAVPVTGRQVQHLRAALDAVERADWTEVVTQLMACRDGYVADGESS